MHSIIINFGVDMHYFLLCHVSEGAGLSLREQGKK
ncbi:putative ORFan [Tupanvirus deep ocean]|uniref:ORFan n=2 Tax=Tupanvirus TaxID=2094720 RepID=A0AC62A9I2_9VIRU|nr:putative ORFan [Tupanvirus deep ocean]QKU34436.1 putative ORFan [Tupanvirus deep ocean]